MWVRWIMARLRDLEDRPLGDCVAMLAFGWLAYCGLLAGLSL